MIKYLLLVSAFMLSSLSAVAGDTYSYSEFTDEQIETLKGIAGEYKNSRGDSMGVTFEEEEVPVGTQGDLFEEEDKEFYFGIETDTGYNFSLNKVEFLANDRIEFTDSFDDCDYPGCETYESTLFFQKNRKNLFYAAIEAEVTADAEDISGVYEDNMDMEEEELEELLDMECKATYGSTASLLSYVDDYKNSVYCDYEFKSFMKKVVEKE